MPVTKPAISFLSETSNIDLATKVDVIIDAMSDNPNFPGQQSGIAEVVTLNTAYKLAITAAADGSRMARADLDAKRAALVARLRVLALYVQLHSNNDMTILLSSGFPAQKSTRTPATILPAPIVQSIRAGMNSGTLLVKFGALGARMYSWRYALASAPTAWINAPQTSAASTSFTGLTPGTVYLFQCNAVNSAGVSDWSETSSFMAT